MRKLFECQESENDFIELVKICEDKIQVTFDPLKDVEFQKIVILSYDDCKELIKELNYLIDKL